MAKNLKSELATLGQSVIVFQGGGALGAYQAGVYEALHEAGVEPDWVIGTSIGAINAAIIAGNDAHDRIAALREFWKRVEHRTWLDDFLPTQFASMSRNMSAIMGGLPAFFTPNSGAFASQHNVLGAEGAGYYSVDPLRKTLSDLVDFDLVNDGEMRLTVGAANVRTSAMTYFDSRKERLDLRHVMASGALPPAFPAVRIGEELYWDGGIISNTPVEAVFDDHPRHDSIVFAVHLWNPNGAEPETIWQVSNRQKDLQYSSRAVSHIKRQRELHKLRHVISELAKMIPAEERTHVEVGELEAYGCTTKMHVVRMLAPMLDNEDHTKDLDFSPDGIKARWEAGRADTLRTLDAAPWRAETEPLEGFVLHEM